MIDPTDAPPGYVAAPLQGEVLEGTVCKGCAFVGRCKPDRHPCTSDVRADNEDVIFVPSEVGRRS